MLKKTITYLDFDENERTEDFYFHLTKAETLKLELSTDGGITEKIQRIVQAKNMPEIIKVFEEFIQLSYGVKTPDGRGFRKTKEDLENFRATNAYSILFMELATNDVEAAKFVNGIIPQETPKQAAVSSAIASISK